MTNERQMNRWRITALACVCTLVAAAVSVAGAWNRSGLPVERALFAALAVLLTVGAHVLPALCQRERLAFRLAVLSLWLFCLLAVTSGHLAFFAAAERHAGEQRAAELPHGDRATAIVARPLTTVAAELANVQSEVHRLRAGLARCKDCPSLEARHAGLTARASALETEQAEARRRVAIEDADDARQRAAMTDPMAGRLSLVLGVTPAAASLTVSIVSALVLELLGCVLWIKASTAARATAPVVVAQPVIASVTPVTKPVMAAVTQQVAAHAACNVTQVGTPAPPAPDAAHLAAAIRRGEVKPTVNAIRQYMSCSQAKASELRRQLLRPGPAHSIPA